MTRKKRYLPQYLLELGAITAVRVHLANQSRLYLTTDQIGDSYERDYADTRIARKMLSTATWALRFMKDIFGEGLNPDDCRALQYAIFNYYPDGSLRRRPFIFRGTRFNYADQPVSSDLAEENISLYHNRIVAGVIPLPPDDWTLA